jgi:tetratricopeptide (TPR) repeat protein
VTRRSRVALAIALGLAVIGGPGAARAQTIWDDPAFALFRQAMDAMSARDFPRASELTDQAIAKLPNHPLAYYLRGQAAAAQSRWEEAAAAFGKTAELYPASFAAHRDLGASLEHLGKVPEAAKAYEAALAIRDGDDLRARLAFMLADHGDAVAARRELEKLTARESTRPEVWSTLARLSYEAKDWAASEKAYARVVTLQNDGRHWFNLGVVRMRLQDLSGALQAFERAAQHADVKQQAEAEAGRLREAMSGNSGTARQLRTPGQFSVPTGPSGR